MTISDRVHFELRRRLMAGHYDPGTQLREEAVASDLGVSRTPVRAAIQRLVAEGLLEAAPNRGARVTPWRRDEAEDIFQIRILLEGHSAGLAADRIEGAQLARMEALNGRIAEAVATRLDGYLDVVHEANLEFHETIYDACGSSHLRQLGFNLLKFPMVVGGFYIYSDSDMAESVRQHEEIISSLRSRNADWARAAMTCHLTAAIERFRRSRSGATERLASAEPGLKGNEAAR